MVIYLTELSTDQGCSQKFLIGEADLVLDYEIMLHLSQIPSLDS